MHKHVGKSPSRIGACVGVAFGVLLIVFFGPLFGGAGGALVGLVYTALVFPLHLLGWLVIVITGKPVGEIRFGLLALLCSLPVTYGLIGWGIGRVIIKRNRNRWA